MRGAARLLGAFLLAQEGERAARTGKPARRDGEQRLVRAPAFDPGRGALRLALRGALADLPDGPAEDGVTAVDDAHAGVLAASGGSCRLTRPVAPDTDEAGAAGGECASSAAAGAALAGQPAAGGAAPAA